MAQPGRRPYRAWLRSVMPTNAPFTTQGAVELLNEAGVGGEVEHVPSRVSAALIADPDVHSVGRGLYEYRPSDGAQRTLRANGSTPSDGQLTVRQVGHDMKGRALLRGSDGALYMAVPWT